MINLSNELNKEHYYQEVLQDYIDKDRKFNLNMTINAAIDRLQSSYTWSLPRLVKIPKPTGGEREVFIFNDLDSFYLRVLNKIFCSNFQVSDNVYSYKRGVRTFNACKDIQRNIKDKSGMKIDISNYFQSVPSEIIISTINSLVSDIYGRQLLYSLYSIDSVHYKDSIITEYLGIMPGTALASFMANYILKDLDEIMIKNVDVYARYSDDILILTKNSIENSFTLFKDELTKYGLTVKDSKVQRYEPNEVIEFLGLIITPTSIDISKSTKNKTKSLIKSICKKYKVLGEKKSKSQREVLMLKALTEINKKLLTTLSEVENTHRGGTLRYIFSSVTIDDSIKELDFYLLDNLRYIISGKHNKGMVSIYPTKWFEENGYHSLTQLYYLYKADRDICLTKIYQMMNPYKPWTNFSLFRDVEVTNIQEVSSKSFISLYDYLVENNGYFITSNNKAVEPRHVIFDIENKEIRLLSDILYKGNEVQSDIRIQIGDKFYIVRGLPLGVCKPINLVSDYLASCYREDISNDMGSILRKFTKPYPFRRVSLSYLLTKVDENVLLFNEDYHTKLNKFTKKIYTLLSSGYSFGDYEYNKVTEEGFTFIINKEWEYN